MTGANGNLIDGQTCEVLDFVMSGVFFQVALLDVFNHIPADVEIAGDIPDAHETA